MTSSSTRPHATALVLAMTLGASSSVGAEPAERVESVFFVAKSENRNQVHYSVAVDSACVPVGDAPVSAEWRMLERGPSEREPLLSREQRVYGLGGQTVVRRPEGGVVVLTLRAISNRPVTVETFRNRRGLCAAKATTRIGEGPAQLTSVFVALRGFGVDAIVLSGRRPDGSVASERVTR